MFEGQKMKVGDLARLNGEKLALNGRNFDEYVRTYGDCVGLLMEAEKESVRYDFPKLFTILFRNGEKIDIAESWLLPIENEE